MEWIKETPEAEDVVNLFMNYETFGELQSAGTGIFEFLKALPYFADKMNIDFQTPSMVIEKRKPIDQIHVPYPMSWADEERDLSAWLGNELQRSAFDKLNAIGERVRLSNDRRLVQDWLYLQSSDHFYYMSTKYFSDGSVHSHFSPYDTPYEAFMNYMNVLSDFIERVNSVFPEGVDNEELNSLLQTIEAQGKIIAELEETNKKLLAKEKNVTTAAPKKKTAPKTSSKKSTQAIPKLTSDDTDRLKA